jgi:transcriptional regulator with XRE-family HTH domain
MMIGMSQDRLGELLGLTFQQVQKYEKGVNRIGASRVFELSRILEVPIQYFFDDFAGEPAPTYAFAEASRQEDTLTQLLQTPDGIELCRHFAEIHDTKVRRRVLDLVRALAESGGHPAETRA